MSKLFLTLILLLTFYNVKAQTILPPFTNEYCPNVDFTFTVTVPGTGPTVIAFTNNPILVQQAYNISTSSGVTSFNFRGRFRDVNINQVFRVNYRLSSNRDTSTDFAFKKIRSLFYSNPVSGSSSGACQPFRASQTSVTAPVCQITNIPVSINATNWSTFGEGNDFCWGSISTYEYQLPAGWSIGANVSNGTNWIPGGTSATVSSDLQTGGTIRIRPTNNCGNGLVNNAAQATIPILRPKPALTFSGQTPICSTATFAAGNIPSWVNNTLWQVSPSGLVSISTPTSNPATFTKNGNGTGSVQFTINGGASCPASFTYNTQEILNNTKIEVGAPVVTWPEVFYPTTGCLPMGFNVSYTSTSQFSAFYEWGYYEGPSGNSNPYVLANVGGSSQQPIRISNTETINRIVVKGGNACGVGTPNIREFTFSQDCNAGGDVEYKIKPKDKTGEKGNSVDNPAIIDNPVKSVLTLRMPRIKQIQQVIVCDISGRKLIVKKPAGLGVMRIDLSGLRAGLYLVTLTDPDNRWSMKFIKE
jgi:hypothetical protein